MESHGVEIKHDHTDNGIFRSARWINHCKDVHQGLNFAEFNSHHQNGQAQRHIRPLQGLAFAYMVHSHHQWSSAITANLWTYAILHAYAIINENPCQRLNYNYTSTQMFTESNVYSNPRYWQPLFRPLCVLSCPFAV